MGKLVNNGTATKPGFALNARYGKTLYYLYKSLNSNLNNKASLEENNYTGKQSITTVVGVNRDSYWNAQVSSHAPYAKIPATRAMYGFGNVGFNGGALYLDIDGRLKWITNLGVVKTIDWT